MKFGPGDILKHQLVDLTSIVKSTYWLFIVSAHVGMYQVFNGYRIFYSSQKNIEMNYKQTDHIDPTENIKDFLELFCLDDEDYYEQEEY